MQGIPFRYVATAVAGFGNDDFSGLGRGDEGGTGREGAVTLVDDANVGACGGGQHRGIAHRCVAGDHRADLVRQNFRARCERGDDQRYGRTVRVTVGGIGCVIEVIETGQEFAVQQRMGVDTKVDNRHRGRGRNRRRGGCQSQCHAHGNG